MVDDDDRWNRKPTSDTEVARHEPTEIAGSDEVYCTNCGRPMKETAKQCPHCGVKRTGAGSSGRAGGNSALTERRQYELEKSATKSPILGALLGFFAPPFGYVYVGKWGWALLNFITLNYLFLGFVLVPLHIPKIISNAKDELRNAGVGGY